jgi:uncharacterized protein YndB with AHSA1/START domain
MSTQTGPKFVYVVYIASSPEKVFAALTDEKTSAQYWSGNRVVSDWKVGSPFALKLKPGMKDVVGKVLAFDPPRRLAYTFQPHHDGLEKEGPSRVTFEIEPLQGQVRLTVTHDEFPAGSAAFEQVNRGWPHVLSSLKSFLETGAGMVAPWYDQEAKSA